MKNWAMSAKGQDAARRALAAAERQWTITLAACALAARRGVDAGTLDHITFIAARTLGEAHEIYAMAHGEL